MSKIPHVYFSILLRLDTAYFLSSRGSSLTGLPFPPSLLCLLFCSCDVRSDLVYIDVCSNLVVGDVWSFLLPAMWSDIVCSLSKLIVVADGHVLVICHNLLSSLDFVTDGHDYDCCHKCVNWSPNINAIKTLLPCFLPCDCHSSQQLGSVSTLLFKGTYFPQE